jgi:hypothetical protein
MGVLFYPSVTDQSCSAVAEDLDPPNWVIFCDSRRDSECLGGMAGGKRLIVAEGLKFKSAGSRIRSHPTDGIFHRCADQAGTDDARRQASIAVFFAVVLPPASPQISKAPISPNDQAAPRHQIDRKYRCTKMRDSSWWASSADLKVKV